jgi:hypothetical protein
MRNPLRRLINRDRPLQSGDGMATLTMRRDVDPIRPRAADDYLVEGDQQVDQPSTAARLIQTLQIVLIVVLAVLSLAVFWLLGLLLNIL